MNSTIQFHSKKFLVLLLAIFSIVFGGAVTPVFAAASQPKGTIIIRTYDVSGPNPVALGKVDIKVGSVNSSLECVDSTKTTASSGPSKGRVQITSCPASSSSSKKFLKYVLLKISKDGYQVAHNSPFKKGSDKTGRGGGTIAVRKNKATTVPIYLINNKSVHSATTTTPPVVLPQVPPSVFSASPNDNTPPPCGTAVVPVARPLAGLSYPDGGSIGVMCKRGMAPNA